MTPVLRWTLSSPLGSKVINDPTGWKELQLVLERSIEYWDVFERFEGDLIFYGNDGIHDGGVQHIRDSIAAYGPKVSMTLFSEISYDGYEYDDLFIAKLDLSQKEEIVGETENSIKCPLIQNDFWSKAKNGNTLKFDLKSLATQGGSAITATANANFNLISQTIIKQYRGEWNEPVRELVVLAGQYIQYDLDTDVIKELKKFGLPITTNPARPVWILEIEEDGDYDFDILLKARAGDLGGELNPFTYIEYYIQKNDEAAIPWSHSVYAPVFGNFYTYTGTLALKKGDLIRLYGLNFSGDDVLFDISDAHLYVSGATTYINTAAQGFTLFNAFDGVLSRLTDTPGGALKSDFLSTGAGSRYGLIRGLQARLYTLTEKPFAPSLKDLWEGANPVLCLGLGYDVIGGLPKIVIEDRAFFFDTSSTSVNISNIETIESKYDLAYFIKLVKIGYKKWQSESSGGIDDPQTNTTYNGIYPIEGTEMNIESTFIAASLALETCRRFTKEKSADYKHDEDIFILSLLEEGSLDPELDENHTAITNLNNPETRYNQRLTQARNFLRHLDFLSGCMSYYPSEVFKFGSAEGNFDYQSTLNDGTPEAGDGSALSSKQDIEQSATPLFIPELKVFKHYQAWEDYTVMRDLRRMAVGISQSSTGHSKVVIKKVALTPATGELDCEFWRAE